MQEATALLLTHYPFARVPGMEDLNFNKVSAAAEAYRTVSSSLGTETPTGILAEIREGQIRLLEEMKSVVQGQQEAEARNQ